jgi:hypothetical protein
MAGPLKPRYAIAVLVLAGAFAAAAAEREHAVHAHGIGRLNLVVEVSTFLVELISPGADIVGFEHAAESAEDKSVVAAAVQALKDGEALFAFAPEARCRLEEAIVESTLIEESQAAGGTAREKAETHAEFHVRYRFDCKRPDRLTHLDVRLFERFPATHELEVQAVLSRGQKAGELTAASPRLRF